MPKLILNADDFGLTTSVNASIIELAELGVLTSTTVLVTCSLSHEAEKLNLIKGLGIGLHINLTQGKPISPVRKIKSLVGSNGCFYDVKTFKKMIFLGRIAESDIIQEVSSQYDLLSSWVGDCIDHFDSHQDILKFKRVSNALRLFAKTKTKKFGLRAYNKSYLIRQGNSGKVVQPHFDNINYFGITRFVKEYLHRSNRARLYPDFHIPCATLYPKNHRIRDLLSILPTVNFDPNDRSVYEIMLHPARSTDGLIGTSLIGSRVEEYNALKSAQFIKFSTREALISFGSLSFP